VAGIDWKGTLNLPKTEFPMRADLAKREPEWLSRWARERQYERLLEQRLAEEAAPFVLHDGPPYPTGGIHYGTVLNKVLKDIVVRSQLIMGKRAVFRPGWDCHGLPIEQQVEKVLGKEAKTVDAASFREACKAHALKFVDVMRAEFKRLGCVGQWEDPYLTVAPDYEATIVRQLAQFRERGLIYRDKKPVHWCTFHRTALAEAEVEYEDHVSPSIYVRFPLVEDLGRADPRLADRKAALVIWTTTPWTLPANLAVVANPELPYVAIPRDGELLVVAAGLAESFLAATGIVAPPETWIPISAEGLRALEGARYKPPFPRSAPAEDDYRLWFAPHATLEAGTGLVHTAPGHGADDYLVGRAQGLQSSRPSTPAAASPRRRATGQARRCSTPTPRSSRTWPGAPCCSTSRARASATSTRTAGAARTRSSSGPPTSGSRASATRATRRRCVSARSTRSGARSGSRPGARTASAA
jgi:isoleucyl-tRNA synthetase